MGPPVRTRQYATVRPHTRTSQATILFEAQLAGVSYGIRSHNRTSDLMKYTDVLPLLYLFGEQHCEQPDLTSIMEPPVLQRK